MQPELLVEISFKIDSWCAALSYFNFVSLQISTCGWGLGHRNLVLTDEMLLEIMKGLGG